MRFGHSTVHARQHALRRVCLLAALITLLSSLSAVGNVVPAVGAQTATFVPFTGTAEVMYTHLPRYDLPSSAAVYAGNYDDVVHFAVRDPIHFRVDIQTIAPAIESGTLTVVVRGTTILSYDTRTGTAGRGHWTLPPNAPSEARAYLESYLLPYFMAGRAPIVAGVPLKPSESVDAYVAELQTRLSHRYPPEYPKSFARIVGQETMLGRNVDVVEFGPLVESDYVTGCSFAHPGHCIHHYATAGTERLWIDRDHPFLLQAVQEGLHDPHSLDVWSVDTTYRVTAISYGTGPSSTDLHYRPPVPVVQTKNWSILASEQGEGTGPAFPLPKGFSYLSPPDGVTQLSVNEGIDERKDGPLPRFTALDILYSSGQHVARYLHPGDRYGFGQYVKGPYMYIEERVQVHGLPTALQVGSPRNTGSCQVWTGTYPHQQHWLALQKGRVSYLIVSNVVSEDRLAAYAATALCS